MKTLFITLCFLFALAIGSIYAANNEDVQVSETRKVVNFSSIEITSVATIYFTQGSSYSLKIEGKEENVKKTKTYVKNGKLVVDRERDENGKTSVRNKSDGVTIYLTAPMLERVDFTGVGSFNCTTPLKLNDFKIMVDGVGKVNLSDLTCKNLKVDLNGVGKADIHVNCEILLANVNGVGSITLSGNVETAKINKAGIGRVNERGLKVKNK